MISVSSGYLRDLSNSCYSDSRSSALVSDVEADKQWRYLFHSASILQWSSIYGPHLWYLFSNLHDHLLCFNISATDKNVTVHINIEILKDLSRNIVERGHSHDTFWHILGR